MASRRTLIPWAKGRCGLSWNVMVPNTFAASHFVSTSCLPGAAVEHMAMLKKQNYDDLSPQTHEFVSLAIETSGVFNSEELEFVKEIVGRLLFYYILLQEDRLFVPALISRDPEREQYLIFGNF